MARVFSSLPRRLSSQWQKGASFPALFSWSSTQTLQTEHMLMFGAITVIIIAVLLLAFWRKKTEPEVDTYAIELDSDDVVETVLQSAMEDQVHFDLVCTRKGQKYRHLQGYFLPGNLKKHTQGERQYIVLEIHPLGIVPKWENAPLDVYFQLTQKNIVTLYHFMSFVQRIYTCDGTAIMEILQPSALSNTQRKEAVRIEATPEMIAMASLWFFPLGEQILPATVAELGPSQAVYRPGDSDFRVMSISASSIRFRFLKDTLDTLPIAFEPGEQICLFLAINTCQYDQNAERTLLWLKGVCSGNLPCAEPDCLDAEYTFTHWQQIAQREEAITWVAATNDDRVPPIMHWIMHAESLPHHKETL